MKTTKNTPKKSVAPAKKPVAKKGCGGKCRK